MMKEYVFMTRTTRFTADVREHINRVVSGKDNRKQLEHLLNVIDNLHNEDMKEALSWKYHIRNLWKSLKNSLTNSTRKNTS